MLWLNYKHCYYTQYNNTKVHLFFKMVTFYVFHWVLYIKSLILHTYVYQIPYGTNFWHVKILTNCGWHHISAIKKKYLVGKKLKFHQFDQYFPSQNLCHIVMLFFSPARISHLFLFICYMMSYGGILICTSILLCISNKNS